MQIHFLEIPLKEHQEMKSKISLLCSKKLRFLTNNCLLLEINSIQNKIEVFYATFITPAIDFSGMLIKHLSEKKAGKEGRSLIYSNCHSVAMGNFSHVNLRD